MKFAFYATSRLQLLNSFALSFNGGDGQGFDSIERSLDGGLVVDQGDGPTPPPSGGATLDPVAGAIDLGH